MHRKPVRRIASICLAVIAAVLVGACGSGSGTSSATSAASSSSAAAAGGGSASGLLPASIKKRGYLNVAGPDGSPPLSELVGTTAQGMDPDIAAALGKALGVTVHYSAVPFDSELAGLAAGKYDLAGGEFYVTPVRIKVANFVSGWHDYSAFLSLKSSSYAPSDTKAALCGHRIGVMAGSAEEASITALNASCSPKMTISSFSNQNQSFLALRSGRIDAVTTGRELLELAAAANPTTFKISGEFGGGPTAWAVPRNAESTQLMNAIVTAFKKIMADNTYTQILSKWHTAYGAVPAPTVYTPSSKLPNYGA